MKDYCTHSTASMRKYWKPGQIIAIAHGISPNLVLARVIEITDKDVVYDWWYEDNHSTGPIERDIEGLKRFPWRTVNEMYWLLAEIEQGFYGKESEAWRMGNSLGDNGESTS